MTQKVIVFFIRTVSFNEYYTNKPISEEFDEILVPIKSVDTKWKKRMKNLSKCKFESVNENEEENTNDKMSDEIEKNDENNENASDISYSLRNRDDIKKPLRYQVNIAEYTPLTFNEAITGPDAEILKTAIE